MKTKKDINEILTDCKEAIKDYELSEEGGDLINQGWVEALKWVLDDSITVLENSKRFFVDSELCSAVDLTEEEIQRFIMEEKNTWYGNALNYVSGGFACITVEDVDWDDFKTLKCVIKFGIQNDCENEVYTNRFSYIRETGRIDYA